ncbi:hypothetical protein DFH08DRAFT_940880 [Mycena albidolilacea]|uniref:Uncharacterized protein n=1 Tax=Mycena albidolilacea TaxID=1033008 RepID=A0AAD7EI96_9AGAR|nr:hypothetical protein DFH08DRAFT_940880 [Mycena albidolilacea]
MTIYPYLALIRRKSAEYSAPFVNKPWKGITGRDSRICTIVCSVGEGPTGHGEVLRTGEDAEAGLGAHEAPIDSATLTVLWQAAVSRILYNRVGAGLFFCMRFVVHLALIAVGGKRNACELHLMKEAVMPVWSDPMRYASILEAAADRGSRIAFHRAGGDVRVGDIGAFGAAPRQEKDKFGVGDGGGGIQRPRKEGGRERGKEGMKMAGGDTSSIRTRGARPCASLHGQRARADNASRHWWIDAVAQWVGNERWGGEGEVRPEMGKVWRMSKRRRGRREEAKGIGQGRDRAGRHTRSTCFRRIADTASAREGSWDNGSSSGSVCKRQRIQEKGRLPQSSLWATTLGPCWVDVEGRSGLKSLRTSTASASGALDMQPESGVSKWQLTRTVASSQETTTRKAQLQSASRRHGKAA